MSQANMASYQQSTSEQTHQASKRCASTDADAIWEEETRGKPTAPASLQMIPWRHSKVIYFVRHGEGYHNLAGHADQKNYLSAEYLDAHLTPFGWKQADALKEHISRCQQVKPEVVVVSPLTRAIETAIGAFGGGKWLSGDSAAPLMLQQDDVENKMAAHEAVSSAGCPPFIAWEGCREHLGVHPCDKRRSTEHYREAYPAIDFSLVSPGEDALWKPDEREGREAIKARGLEFTKWLMTRPEQHIAVISHSSFLFFLTSNFGAGSSDLVSGELHRWFDNCELRTVVLSDSRGEGNLDPLWFPGGKKLST